MEWTPGIAGDQAFVSSGVQSQPPAHQSDSLKGHLVQSLLYSAVLLTRQLKQAGTNLTYVVLCSMKASSAWDPKRYAQWNVTAKP